MHFSAKLPPDSTTCFQNKIFTKRMDENKTKPIVVFVVLLIECTLLQQFHASEKIRWFQNHPWLISSAVRDSRRLVLIFSLTPVATVAYTASVLFPHLTQPFLPNILPIVPAKARKFNFTGPLWLVIMSSINWNSLPYKTRSGNRIGL